MAPMFTRSTPTDKAINVRRQLKNTKKKKENGTQKIAVFNRKHEKNIRFVYTISQQNKRAVGFFRTDAVFYALWAAFSPSGYISVIKSV